MGGGMGGLYLNSYGTKQSKAPYSAAVLHGKAKAWAKNKATQLKAISNNKRNDFNTACVVYDYETGNYYYGRNKGIKLNGTEKSPILFGNEVHPGILPKKSLNDYIIGNCAEVDAVNNALNAGAKLHNLYMTTIHTYENDFGKLKHACENCTYTFRGKIRENYAGWEN